MNDEMILTIAIITMNRAEQLKEAIDSCLSSRLPDKTQFVIVDNASTDNTKTVIADIRRSNPQYEFDYFYSAINLGVGGGRNKAFSLSKGKYIYFLDDDAIIASECYNTFFMKCIELMENNLSVASLSTNIYDIICGNKRNIQGHFAENELTDILSWRGGSHFLRHSVFKSPLYLNILYGSEELVPSIYIWHKGLRNVYFDDVRIIHQPRVNKWCDGTTQMTELKKLHNAMRYATYKLLYPSLFYPIINLAMKIRCKKHLPELDNAFEVCMKLANHIIQSHQVDKISIRTVIRLWWKFKWTVF